jgi:hypothetical protein
VPICLAKGRYALGAQRATENSTGTCSIPPLGSPEVGTSAGGRARSAVQDTTVDLRFQQSAENARRRGQVSWPVLGALAALMVVSSVAHVWGLHRDLPVADPDENAFVRPAVHIAATGDLNPHVFGHPGSTVIYPLAGLVHAWELVAHDGPIVTSDASLSARFERSPTEFYLIGRLWTIALSVGALPLLFLVGRRAFNARVALIATALWAVLPYPVQLGRVVRTDSAGVFFGLLALWLCLRLLDDPRIRWCVLAGVGVGLAVSSRCFMVALVPVLVAAAVLPYRRALRSAIRSAGIALASAVGGFALSTPYFFLDWHTAFDSIRDQDTGPGLVSQVRVTRTACDRSASTSGWASTPARSNCETERSVGSRSTSVPESRQSLMAVTSSCRAPSPISSPGRVSSLRTVAPINSRAGPATGSCSP